MKAFVTGSTGLLGGAVVRELESRGADVVALARSADKAAKFLSDTQAQIVIGDMLDIDGFAPHMAGCDVVFHTAAYFKEYTGADSTAEEKLQKINVDGTIHLLNAAKAHEVRNVIYTSSSGVLEKLGDGTVTTERNGFNHSTVNRYFQSKIRAEQAIASWLPKNPDMRVVLILPTAIIGPGDNGPTGLGNMMIDTLKRDLPAIPPGGVTFVDVRDCAFGMVEAVEKGESGERFIMAKGFQKLSDLVPLVAQAGGVKSPSFALSRPVGLAFATVAETIAKVTGGQPLVTRVIMKTLTEAVDISAEKAEQELGVSFRPIDESIRDSVAWFKQFGYV